MTAVFSFPSILVVQVSWLKGSVNFHPITAPPTEQQQLLTPCCPLFFRMIVCNQVMKFILDKIEKDEKQAAKKRKKEEVVEQKRSKQNATKLTALLYKHKEQLKAEILKKRALLDKELQLQVQVSTVCLHQDAYVYVKFRV